MAKSMTKSQIEDHIAKKVGVQKKTVREILQEMADLSYREANNSFTIPGIGKLVLVNRAARTGRNPRTGEAIEIPAKKVVKFRIAKACKDEVLKHSGE
ncbi:MAG: HU family DNA-binding protein [Deltaproteobacteria bacterium]|nr:HU family DNA-binding protein [Deltaproteobacteria bacterium]